MKPLLHVILLIGLLATVTQSLSATCWVSSFSTPNASTDIAEQLRASGELRTSNFWTRLRGPYPAPDGVPLRMFHLPGEPLYLAAGFGLLPAAAGRYLHVPVTALLITAACAVIAAVAGRRAGLIAGGLACFNPFVLLHGPVWDDLFLGAALEWTVVLLAVLALRDARPGGGRRWAMAGLAGLAAAGATLTRSQSLLTLGGFAVVLLVMPRLRAARPVGTLLLVGVATAAAAWGLRNQAVVGHFTLGSSHDGITLWESNYPHAAEAIRTTGQVERMNARYMQADYDRTRSMSEFEADAYFKRRATAHLFGHPAQVLAAVPLKSFIDLSGWDPGSPLRSPRNVLSLLSNGLLLILAAAGAASLRRFDPTDPTHLAAAAMALSAGSAVILLLVIGPVGLRYRATIEPFFWLSAAIFLRDRLGSTAWRPGVVTQGRP